jgi:hypothetical protein
MSDAIAAMWDGEHFDPLGRFKKKCDQDFVVGQVYSLEVILERSDNSHRHYFAAVHQSWMNLPEREAERFPTSEHLRKYCLIKAGFCDQRSIACTSKAEAQRIAAFVMPMDSYALVTVKDAVVVVYTAKSQSYRAMGKEDFQKSKTAVLDLLAEMIGVTRGLLEKAGATC